jgi:DNA-binding NtrC family response regulator
MSAGLQDALSLEYSRGFYLHPSTGASIQISGALLATSTMAEEDDVMEKLSPGFREITTNRMLRMPPLRERKNDIPALVEEFISIASEEFGKKIQGITAEALAVLEKDAWPGNVHQLKATVRRAVMTAGDRIDVADVEVPTLRNVLVFEDYPQITVTRSPLKNQVRRHIAEIERQLISDTLKKTHGNKAKASRLLGITYKTMLKKVAEYQLEREKGKG